MYTKLPSGSTVVLVQFTEFTDMQTTLNFDGL
jgi:hypothetical protein